MLQNFTLQPNHLKPGGRHHLLGGFTLAPCFFRCFVVKPRRDGLNRDANFVGAYRSKWMKSTVKIPAGCRMSRRWFAQLCLSSVGPGRAREAFRGWWIPSAFVVVGEKIWRGGNPPAGCRSFHDVYCNYSLITGCGAGSRNIKAARFFPSVYINFASRLLPVIRPHALHQLPQSCSRSQNVRTDGFWRYKEKNKAILGIKLRLWWGESRSWPFILSLLSKPSFF